MFALIPIIGSGKFLDPYRIDAPPGVSWSANIPSDANGVPVYLDAITWLDDWSIVPSGLVTRLKSEQYAMDLTQTRAPAARLKDMKRLPQVRDVTATVNYRLAEDHFIRADGPLGPDWDDGYTGLGSLAIVGNRVRAGTIFTDCLESYNAVSFPNDQWAEAIFAKISASTGSAPRVSLRVANPATVTMYNMLILQGLGGTTSRIDKVIAGAFTILASDSSVTWGDTDILLGTAVGSTLALYRNRSTTAVLTTTDTELTSGRAGMLLFIQTGSTLDQLEVEYWSAGSFVDDFLLDDGGLLIRHQSR